MGDLVSRNPGDSSAKTNELVDSALGGVLYVVDAFSLFNENIAGADESGAEAVRTLLKRAEDGWETLIIILSGPQKPMEQFLASNPRLEAGSMTVNQFPDVLIHRADDPSRIVA